MNKILNIIKKYKYIIIGISILLIIILLIFFLTRKSEPIPLEKVFSTTNFKDVRVKKSNRKISEKYELKKYKIYETRKDIKLNDLIGKVLFVRSKEFNANIFQTRKEITKEAELPILMQVESEMEYLKQGALNYLKLDSNTLPISESLTGISKYDFPMPTRESVYTEKRHYTSTYIDTNGEKYDINFYMDNEYLVCELVKFINNE